MNQINLNFKRTLKLSYCGEVHTVELSIPKIVFLEDRQKWACYYSIPIICEGSDLKIYGDDPLEALTRILALVSKLLRDSGYPDMKVHWQEKGDNGGLPRFETP